MLESEFRHNVVVPDLKKLRKTWFESIQQVSITATPDILASINGYFVAIELKAENGKTAPLQRYKLDQIIASGGVAFSVKPSEWEQVYGVLKRISEDPWHKKRWIGD